MKFLQILFQEMMQVLKIIMLTDIDLILDGFYLHQPSIHGIQMLHEWSWLQQQMRLHAGIAGKKLEETDWRLPNSQS